MGGKYLFISKYYLNPYCFALIAEVIEKANEYFIVKRKQPVFNISIIRNAKQNELDNGVFLGKPNKRINEVSDADLIIIPLKMCE